MRRHVKGAPSSAVVGRVREGGRRLRRYAAEEADGGIWGRGRERVAVGPGGAGGSEEGLGLDGLNSRRDFSLGP
jgi:hypothetical protein